MAAEDWRVIKLRHDEGETKERKLPLLQMPATRPVQSLAHVTCSVHLPVGVIIDGIMIEDVQQNNSDDSDSDDAEDVVVCLNAGLKYSYVQISITRKNSTIDHGIVVEIYAGFIIETITFEQVTESIANIRLQPSLPHKSN